MIARLLSGLILLMGWSAPLAAQPQITVRSGDHPDFSRIVFDFTQPPEYSVSLAGDRLTITFDRPFAFDFGSLPEDPLDRLAEPETTVTDVGTRVELRVAGRLRPRHFLSGASLVVDAVDSADAAPADAPSISAPSEPAAAEASRENAASPESAVVTAEADSGGEAVRVTALQLGDGLQLNYLWPEETSAAVFARGGYLWVVFAGSRPLDHSALDWRPETPLGERLGSMQRLKAEEHTVLRYRLAEGQRIAVSREDGVWQVELRDSPTFPRNAIEPQRRTSGDGKPALFLSAERVGPKLRIADPEAGDTIEIMPLGDPGRAMASDRQFAEFELPATAQGIVLAPNAGDVALRRYANGVGVESDAGLALSTEFLSGPGAEGPESLLDFAAWRRGGPENFVETEQALLVRLSMAPLAERRAARWDLARFYLSHGFAAAARGLLDLMLETDTTLAQTPEWQAVSGVTLLELGRPEEALKALLSESLDPSTEIWLWRALAAEAAGRREDALAYFDRGKGVLSRREEGFRARLRLAVARAALARGTLDIAENQITALQEMQLAKPLAAEADLLYGRLAAARGDMATAAARFEDAATARDRRVSTAARLALTRLLLAEGNIDRKEAIARLERLRFAWRGDELELELLNFLGGLHVEAEQYRKGLETLRIAAAAFSETSQANAIARRMSEVFQRLFLEGAADALSPVEALALFYDFRELTPLGAEGDRMIRHLVDRLVAVELLDRAADLLRHQVEFRLEGLPRALVATRLAKIYLLDDRPQEALEVMQASRDRSAPVEILRERSLVEARALAELGRAEEALALLEDDDSPAARQLEADIYWRRQDWPALAALAAEIMSGRWQSREPLGSAERMFLMRRALALSFLDRGNALRRLRERYRPLMKDGELEAMFNLLTSEDPPPRGELARIAGNLSNVAQYRAFLSAYREEFSAAAAAGATAQGASPPASAS